MEGVGTGGVLGQEGTLGILRADGGDPVAGLDETGAQPLQQDLLAPKTGLVDDQAEVHRVSVSGANRSTISGRIRVGRRV